MSSKQKHKSRKRQEKGKPKVRSQKTRSKRQRGGGKLRDAAYSENIGKVKRLLEEGAEIEARCIDVAVEFNEQDGDNVDFAAEYVKLLFEKYLGKTLNGKLSNDDKIKIKMFLTPLEYDPTKYYAIETVKFKRQGTPMYTLFENLGLLS